MKQFLFLFLFPVWLMGQTSTQNRITFRSGETPAFAIKAPPGAMEITFRNSLERVIRKFTTSDSSITKIGDSLYVFRFTNRESIGNEGRGTWQAEINIAGLGIRKTDVFQYEIYKATTSTSNTTPVTGTPYNMVMTWDFSPAAPTFNVIASGLITVDKNSIDSAVVDAQQAQAAAIEAKTDAEVANLSAQAAKDSTLSYRNAALSYRNSALTSANTATAGATTATTQAGIATARATEAGIARDTTVSARGTTLTYRNEVLAAYNNLTTQGNFKGAWNAATNTPTLTTTASALNDYYDVTVSGTQSITGSSTAFAVGDRVKSTGTSWVRVPFGQLPLKEISHPAATAPDFRGQIGIWNNAGTEQEYLARSIIAPASLRWTRLVDSTELRTYVPGLLTSYPLRTDILKVIDHPAATSPDFRGQVGIWNNAGTEQEYIARSITAPMNTRWVRMVDSTMMYTYVPGLLTNYPLRTDMLKVISHPSVVAPDFRGQVGIWTDGSTEKARIARSTTAPGTLRWLPIVDSTELRTYVPGLLANYPLRSDMLKVISHPAATSPDFRGQVGSWNNAGTEQQYIARSITAPMGSRWVRIVDSTLLYTYVPGQLANYTLRSQMLKTVVSPTVTAPDFRGQLTIWSFAGAERLYAARSVTAGGVLNWTRVVDSTMMYSYVPGLLTNYPQRTDVYKVLSHPAAVSPDFRGQFGVWNDGGVEKYRLARSITAPMNLRWAAIVDSTALAAHAASAAIISRHVNEGFFSASKVISNVQGETYAHSAYPVVIGDTAYVSYMYNATGLLEGDPNQFCRLAKFNLYKGNPVYYNTATAGDAITGGGTLGTDLSVPSMIRLASGNLRIFFRFNNQIYRRDFNVSNNTLGAISRVQCTISNNATVVDMNLTNAYSHLTYLFGSGHGIGDSPDLFITSEIISNAGKLYTALSVGGGLGKTTTSIVIESSDEGATWKLCGAPDPRTMPGVTGTDTKYCWEGALSFDATYCYMYVRGGGTQGTLMTRALLTDLFTFSAPVKVWNTGNQKPCIFTLPNVGTFLVVESAEQMTPTAESNRTAVDVIRVTNYSTYTRQFTMRDWGGVHTFSYFQKNGNVYVSYTTGLRKLHEKNCSEISFGKIERRWLQ